MQSGHGSNLVLSDLHGCGDYWSARVGTSSLKQFTIFTVSKGLTALLIEFLPTFLRVKPPLSTHFSLRPPLMQMTRWLF